VETTSRLSDTPILMPQSHYQDVVFHCAVEGHEAKVIPFVPPDAQFILKRCRVTATESQIPVWLNPKFTWSKGDVSLDISLRPEATLPKHVQNVEVSFELPDGVPTPSLAAPDGRATFQAVTREIVWLIGTSMKDVVG
jgi:hypothetical protein